MEEVIWIEVLSRHRDVAARWRCTGRVVRIGRAYTNDVVLDDPHVAPEHLQVLRDADGALIAEDLDTANGLLVDGRVRVKRAVLHGDQPIRIGDTYLRFRDPAHPVSPERVVVRQSRWPAVVALSVAALGLKLLSIWLDEFSEPRIVHYVVPLVLSGVLVAGWSGVWAVLARVFSGQARFERNLAIALAGALAYLLYALLSGYLAFSFPWRALVSYQSIPVSCLLAGICFLHLREISPSRLRAKAAAVTGLLALAIGLQVLAQVDPRAGFDKQDYVRRLVPPALRLARLQSEDAFFGDVEKLQGQLDAARADEP